ncbi:Retrovirus-related Pol polyprotein from transposon RE1, partial [Linum grandiflorum]
KGYRCLDRASGRIYVSRHVLFDETTFPFADLKSGPLTESISSTTSPSVPVSLPLPPTSLDNTHPRAQSSLPNQAKPNPPFPDPQSTSFTPSPLPNTITSPSSKPPPPPTLLTYRRRPRPPFNTSPRLLNPSPTTAAPRRMVTRAQTGKLKPKTYMADASASIPTSATQALTIACWRAAMSVEYAALLRNGTWELVPPPSNCNLLSNRWVFALKTNPDGSIERHKARLVARGFEQIPGHDFDQTFSPVLKPATLRLLLGIAVSHSWPLHQLDISNAFLHGTLTEEVYMQQPVGFVDPEHPDYVCRLKKSLYGLRQAPRAWFHCLTTALQEFGFQPSKTDPSLFIYKSGSTALYLLVYVDDIVITGTHSSQIQLLLKFLQSRFALRDLGRLSYFLGIEVHHTSTGLVLSQRKYISELLQRAGMVDAKPMTTPCTADQLLQSAADTSPAFSDPGLYRSIVGGLQYLNFTRPDISFAVNHVSQFLHQPTESHWCAVKRILRFLRGTIAVGLSFQPSVEPTLHGYSDASFASSPKDRKSITGYAVFFGKNLVSWSTRKQRAVARSSTECEYRALATLASEVIWLQSLLSELHIPQSKPPVLWCDNLGATYLAHNPVFHSRSKHLEIEFHFVRDRVAKGQFQVRYIPATDQLADVLTKPLTRMHFQHYCSKFHLHTVTLAGA